MLNNSKPEEVALYIRVSTEEQALNGDSLRTQRDELTKYALKNGFHIFGIYEDDGFTATNLKRPALKRLLQDVKENKINRILITKLDRLSRGVRNYYKILDTLDEHGVFWQTIFEKYDSSTASGRLHINIMLSVAENESAQTSERIRSVFKTKIENKEIISGKIPIGLKKENKKIIIDNDKKEIIEDAFKFHNETGSVYKTFRKLDIKYPKLELNYMRTYRILTNKMYIGIKETKYGNVVNYCPAIIDNKIFNNTQKLINKNQRKPNHNNSGGYIFQKLLKCAECGHILGGKFYSQNNDTSKYYYVCKHHCSTFNCSCSKNWNETKIEEKLLNELNNQLAEYISSYEYKQKELKNNDFSKEIYTIENKLVKLKDLYVRDLIRIEDYEKDYKYYIQQLEQLNNENNKIIKETATTANIENLKIFLNKDFSSLYNKLSREEKRRLLISFIDYIIIDQDYNINISFI